MHLFADALRSGSHRSLGDVTLKWHSTVHPAEMKVYISFSEDILDTNDKQW